jgi:hypothetical protein
MATSEASIAEYVIIEPPTAERVDSHILHAFAGNTAVRLILQQQEPHLAPPIEVEMTPIIANEATRRIRGDGPRITSIMVELGDDLDGPATACIVWNAEPSS